MRVQIKHITYVLLALIFIFTLIYFRLSRGTDAAQPSKIEIQTTIIASGLEFPWGLDFLPNGDILITEREGRLRIIRNGTLDPNPIQGLPDNIYVAGQGGLLDVTIDPDFEQNQFIYFSYVGKGEGGAGTEVARAKLNGNKLENVDVIFKVSPKTEGQNHYGSRLIFADDGTLYITTGDRYSFMEEAQNPENHLGTIIRINPDGSVPTDNPFANHETYRPEIYAYGIRNAQGISIHPETRQIWYHEHGPRGGDEINILRAGANYGWPEITYGIDYSGLPISSKTEALGMEQPVLYWDPSIAPSGMVFYTGDKFPKWKNHLFVGALAGTHLRKIELDGEKVINQEKLLEDYGRIRDVKVGPDGFLYVLVDSHDGQVVRLEPAQ
ncbi:MAG: PQQ-dependent sugar dehydrogenase [Alphaproteobacteria bacterium]|nr:PQQ-dependent sugar dehydrogenase [Alphaproteobacteria bacterium]